MSKNILLTAEPTAQWLGIPKATLYDKVRNDEIPHVRMGRLIRFDREQIERFIANGGTK